MDALMLLIPLSLILGLGALALFLWALRSGQFEDLDGAARRILFDDDPPRGTPSPPPSPRKEDQP
ncbi:cbb3-type cytochrome oxidase assembly protein CcoS [Elioraea thermophila]|uniref:cbb3-type cytochrome oxidase assembly protein CcoS n=1 Tax=Elioraea thermophila TaxID=2185104 RepID=UPI000DF306FF|nr:cbb3-type cytochrome oxidase assembly protein CcoS [Elioraea thermophila]MCS6920664.1 cbb3-type cytochrome oxidase assembly protein CcoS [Elioraea sp.]